MEQEKRQKEITRHGLIRVGLWLGGGWLLLVLCAWGILPDREVPGILWVGLGLLTAELAILWGKTWWESRGRGQAIPAGAHWWQAEKEELAAAAVMLAVWWGFLALCAAGVLPHMEPDRYSWLLAGAVTILFGAELLLYPTAIGSEPILSLPGLQIYPDRRKIYHGQQEIELNTKEFALLCLLVTNKGRVLTYGQMYEKVWKEEPFGNEHIAVGSHVRSMRQKLYAVYPKPPFVISCIRDVGYRFEVHS